jgi:2-phospho-L-lactate guanylyltransferase
MSTAVVIPMKDAAQSKTRLALAMTPAQRRRMSLALFRRALDFFAVQFPEFDRLVVTSSPRIAGMARDCGAASLMEQGSSGLNRAVSAAFQWARRAGYVRLLVVPADIPVWLRSEVAELFEAGESHAVVIARAHDGGTNGLLINLIQAGGFEFRYGKNSAQRHAESAEAVALDAVTRTWPFLSRDIDTADDCLLLSQALATF